MSIKSSIQLSPLSIEIEGAVASLIRRNLEGFDEHDVLIATFRRLKNLHETYLREACQFLVAIDIVDPNRPIACAGLGPFHGLPLSEGVGEIRDLVVEESYRGRGIGKLLLDQSLHAAKTFGYRRLYLETSKSMLVAQRLFESRGFRPVTEKSRLISNTSLVPEEMPCYYLLESL